MCKNLLVFEKDELPIIQSMLLSTPKETNITRVDKQLNVKNTPRSFPILGKVPTFFLRDSWHLSSFFDRII
jgi:hypothetical protein